MSTAHPEFEHALPGFAAFKDTDLVDAEHREPARELTDYAASRELEYLATLNPQGFWGVVPADGRLQFNVMRGTLAGGRYGVLFHKLLGISVRWDSVRGRYEADSGADLVGLHYEAQGRAKVRSLLALLPVVGPLVEPANRGDPRPSQVGVPVTVGAAAVPEVATVADFRCGNRLHRGKLDRAEQHSTPVRGIHLQRTDGHDPDPDFVARLMATPLVDILREYAERPFFRLTVDHAQLSIELDGFSYAPSELDALGVTRFRAAPHRLPRPAGRCTGSGRSTMFCRRSNGRTSPIRSSARPSSRRWRGSPPCRIWPAGTAASLRIRSPTTSLIRICRCPDALLLCLRCRGQQGCRCDWRGMPSNASRATTQAETRCSCR